MEITLKIHPRGIGGKGVRGQTANPAGGKGHHFSKRVRSHNLDRKDLATSVVLKYALHLGNNSLFTFISRKSLAKTPTFPGKLGVEMAIKRIGYLLPSLEM